MIRSRRVPRALLLVALAGACSEGEQGASSNAPAPNPALGGPLQSEIEGGEIYRLQGYVDRKCRVTFGDLFENVTDEPVTIVGAEHSVVDGVTVLDIVKIPEGTAGVGNPPGYPPRELKKRWPQVQPLVGSVIRPGEYVSFAVGLHLDGGKRGSVANIGITYEVGGKRYTAVDNDSFHAVAKPGQSCAP